MTANSSPPTRQTMSEPRDRRAEDVGEELEHLVALAVPADVVHALEVVDVEHHQRDRVVRPPGAVELGSAAARGSSGGCRGP